MGNTLAGLWDRVRAAADPIPSCSVCHTHMSPRKNDEQGYKETVEQLKALNDVIKELDPVLRKPALVMLAPFVVDPELVAEGWWLSGMLAGPPSDDSDPRLLGDSPP